MVDLNRLMRIKKPNGYSANICDGIDGAWTEKLTEKEKNELIRLLARIGESSYRRGVQQGAALFEKGSLLPDLEDWRYRNCIDFAPPADSKFLFADMPYAVDRLWCEEYRQGLNKIGLHE